MTSFVKINAENYHLYIERILEIEDLSFPSPWSFRAFLEEIKNPISHLWVVVENKVLSGNLCFWMFDREIQIINLAVHPTKRNRGLGQYLLTKMIEEGISKGIPNIWLEVRKSNLAAKHLYEKFGFEAVGCRPRYYKETNEDAIIMALTLTEMKLAV
jgi:[ribosomal protein S18]-alanine N-acetyltransferase